MQRKNSRAKGQTFERLIKEAIVDGLKDLLPRIIVRRSVQAERAHDSDVIIEGDGVPQWLCDLWIECNHADAPNPVNKLTQAQGDSMWAIKRTGRKRLPLVIWRRTRERTLWVTATLETLLKMVGFDPSGPGYGHPMLIGGDVPTTVDLAHVVRCLRERLTRHPA